MGTQHPAAAVKHPTLKGIEWKDPEDKLSRLSTWREKQRFREGKMMKKWSRTMFPKDVKSKRPLEDVDSLIVIFVRFRNRKAVPRNHCSLVRSPYTPTVSPYHRIRSAKF